MSETLLILILLIIPSIVTSTPVDNGVVGDPEVKCAESFIGIDFKTKNPFAGHVFVKSHYGDPGCRTDETNKNDVQIQLAFNSCGVRRSRSANPRGIFVSTTVIITFHSQFITKVDKAYAVQCFYMEAEKIVTTEIEISMLTTSFQTQTVPMPTCRYEVLENGPFGNPVRYAKIGEQVYHKWTCDTQTSDVFCMVVHSCKVDDGSGNKVLLLDTNGCAQDKFLLGNLEYPTDLMAGRESHVFKYADRPSLFFNCQISIVVKEPGTICPRPLCPDPPRGKRSVATTSRNITNEGDIVDVDSDSIIVLDLDPKTDRDTGNFKSLLEREISTSDSDVCMSLAGLSGYTIVNVILIISSTVLFLAAYRKQITSDKIMA